MELSSEASGPADMFMGPAKVGTVSTECSSNAPRSVKHHHQWPMLRSPSNHKH